jgi:hypothetical protein
VAKLAGPLEGAAESIDGGEERRGEEEEAQILPAGEDELNCQLAVAESSALVL